MVIRHEVNGWIVSAVVERTAAKLGVDPGRFPDLPLVVTDLLEDVPL